ncbi:aldose 1-epimerase [Winogradskyella sediminis]|nr:aldose 1-epimerase [Winogradskyella sediminis]
MYTITHITKDGLDYVRLKSPNGKTAANICLTQGGRLSQFIFEEVEVISEIKPETYKDNYASSILFPFANRIKDGNYNFDGVAYNLQCNEADKNNALHGLVYNKYFSVVDKHFTSGEATLTLGYIEDYPTTGFPFKYEIKITYVLSSEGIKIKVDILNKDKKPFPFTLGWHPYFTSSNLTESFMDYSSSKCFLQDHQNITTGTADFKMVMPFQVKDKKLDDAYALENNVIKFLTPQYNVIIKSSSEENFLQLYTPNDPNIIAIEPMTGVSDSFNNKTGLQVLNANDSYSLEWNVMIKKV